MLRSLDRHPTDMDVDSMTARAAIANEDGPCSAMPGVCHPDDLSFDGSAAKAEVMSSCEISAPSDFSVRFTAADYEQIARGIRRRFVYRFIKRAFDILFSLCVIIVLFIPLAVVCLVIYLDDPAGSPLFAQKRVGLDGREFTMYKLRSICVDAEARLEALSALNEKTGPVFKMANDPRITRVGRFIRKTSVAPVIIGTPGDGEPTKSFSHPENSSLDLQKCERRPESILGARPHYTSSQFLSFAVFGGPERTSGRPLRASSRAPFASAGAVA